MLKIKFDPEAAKTALFEGPFESREGLEGACETVTGAEHKYWDAYQKWAATTGAENGSIITNAYNRDYIIRRLGALDEQLKLHTGEPTKTTLKHSIPSQLRNAFEKAASGGQSVKMLTIATTRENLFFDLRKAFPATDFYATNVVGHQGHAAQANEMVRSKDSALTEKLEYVTTAPAANFDIVHVNAAIFYNDKEGVAHLLNDITNTGAKYVVFSNMINSTNANAAEEWYGQRNAGGIVPFRALPPQEIATVMQSYGYTLANRQTAKASYDVRSDVNISQLLALDNLSFER